MHNVVPNDVVTNRVYRKYFVLLSSYVRWKIFCLLSHRFSGLSTEKLKVGRYFRCPTHYTIHENKTKYVTSMNDPQKENIEIFDLGNTIINFLKVTQKTILNYKSIFLMSNLGSNISSIFSKVLKRHG